MTIKKIISSLFILAFVTQITYLNAFSGALSASAFRALTIRCPKRSMEKVLKDWEQHKKIRNELLISYFGKKLHKAKMLTRTFFGTTIGTTITLFGYIGLKKNLPQPALSDFQSNQTKGNS